MIDRLESQYRKWLYTPEAHMRKPSNIHPTIEAALAPFSIPCQHERCVMWCPDCGIPPPSAWLSHKDAPIEYTPCLMWSDWHPERGVRQGYFDRGLWISSNGSQDGITHWMRLPEPPAKAGAV